MYKSFIAILAVIFSYLNVSSQVKKTYSGEIPAPVKTDESVLIQKQNQPPPSKELMDFQNKMKAAKESGNRDEVIQLARESDRITGTHTEVPKQLQVKETPFIEADNIIINTIEISSDKIITAMTTCTEQTGNNIGRIWAIYKFYLSNSTIQEDQIGVKFSDDNGNNWTHFRSFTTGGGYSASDLQVDAELIISSSNQKFLWITYARRIASEYNHIGMSILDLNSMAVSALIISWPGDHTNVHYKTPRIVSDNSYYPNTAFIYLIASYDSIGIQSEKVAVCYNPYIVYPEPSFTYRASNFMRKVNTGITGPSDYFNCDIAYFRNGGQDSILLVETGLQSNSSIILGSTSTTSFLTSNLFTTYLGSININTNKRSRGFVASNGPFNNLMISVINEYSVTDHDVEYYHSTNGSSGWSQGFIDYSLFDTKTDPDIAGQINAQGKFAVAFTNAAFGNPPRVSYFQSDSYNWGFVDLNSYSNLASNTRMPKAGIKLNTGNENCFAIWADSTNHGLWSSSGCTGPVQTYAKLNLPAAIEALHDPNFNTLIPDTIRVYLRNNFAPYSVVDSSVNILSNLYLNEFTFGRITHHTPYYIHIKHRNALESWSSGTIAFTSYEKFYSFLPQASTYGGNSKKIFDNGILTIYGFYSGDVNQDGAIDLADVLQIYNDANSFLTGYVVTDLTGNNVVDLTDVLIAYNNSVGFVSVVKP